MINKFPKITVITPSYNQADFIEQTITSVLSQRYPNLEYWVIDGGSTDGTVNILKKYSNRLFWISEKDKGQTDAINKGMKKATGEIVCYLNSDDIFLRGSLIRVAKAFILNPESTWLTGDYFIINSQRDYIQPYIVKYKSLLRHLQWPTILFVANYIVQPSTFWRRSVFKTLGYFNPQLRYCMDYDFWLRLISVQKPILLHRPLSAFRIHSNSKGGSQYQQQFSEQEQVVKSHTSNILLTTLHKLHSAVTVLAYRIIK